MINFEQFVGKKTNFYVIENNKFKITEGVFEVIEDPDDGYRSSLEGVQLLDYKDIVGCFGILAQVEICQDNEDNFLLRDNDGHVWLRFGTDYGDDYYPCFIFSYDPLEVKKKIASNDDEILLI